MWFLSIQPAHHMLMLVSRVHHNNFPNSYKGIWSAHPSYNHSFCVNKILIFYMTFSNKEHSWGLIMLWQPEWLPCQNNQAHHFFVGDAVYLCNCCENCKFDVIWPTTNSNIDFCFVVLHRNNEDLLTYSWIYAQMSIINKGENCFSLYQSRVI